MNKRAEVKLVDVSALPEPPYPSDTHSGSFSFDLDMSRVTQSKTWLLASPEIRAWLLCVWSLSWTRVPCGTWPNDDEEIAAHLGCEFDWFCAHKKRLMRNWVLHSDDRLYHPVITEKVQHFLSVRKNWADKKKRQRGEMSPRDSQGSPPRVPLESPPSYTSSSSSSSSASHSRGAKAPLSGKCPTTRSAEAILDYLNEKTGSRFEPVKANIDKIKARLREYDEKTLIEVVDIKCAEWCSDEDMRKFLRPATLFGAEKCAQYVGQAQQSKRQRGNW